ncbi:MAG: EAL domain-containing protein [Polyangiaceae bacterium]
MLLEGGRVVGVEALLRWTHPEEGPLSPAEFIPVAEDSGLIVPIGARVLSLACEQLARWNALGLDGMTMSVNVAARQFRDEDFVPFVRDTVERSGIHPRSLELEITERTLMDDTEVSLRVLGELRGLGIRVAIDDFGTGYSSLSYLKRFPIDAIKVDRSFVADIPGDGDSSAIAEAIIAMGNSLDMEVVAEGVETKAQMDFLARSRCPSAQGFLFCRPLPAEEVERWCFDQAARRGDGGR